MTRRKRRTPSPSTLAHPCASVSIRGLISDRPELAIFLALLAIFNFPILFGGCWRSMIFQSDAVLQGGQWWRVLTHPFVHVTWYHLTLDGTAFLALYSSLLEPNLLRRLSYVIAGAAGSLVLSWVASGRLTHGLCGLSGIAHGLMAVSAIEMITSQPTHPDPATRRIGWISFTLVVLKGGYEALTGHMCLEFLSFGMLGDPIAVSHAGGIVGSLTAMLTIHHIPRISRR